MTDKTKFALVFDDGFAATCRAVSKLFEAHDLPAVFAVMVEPGDFAPGIGDWRQWNDLSRRGHLIHPHGFDHTHLTPLPHEEAVERVDRCLVEFQKRLNGF